MIRKIFSPNTASARQTAFLLLAAAALLGGCARSPEPLPLSRHDLAAYRAMRSPAAQSLPNPVRGHRFDDTWGARRSGGRSHQGVDIFARTGTPVRSTTDGIIIRIGNNRLGGRYVAVQGPGAWHYYAHLDRFSGHRLHSRVRAGEIIGYVGDSGNAKGTPPHLHYGVYLTRGGAVNPYPLIDQSR